MPLLETRDFKETILELLNPEGDLLQWNHVLEPEFHQSIYVSACTRAARAKGAFQLGEPKNLKAPPHRGTQPKYADIEDDADSLDYEGMVLSDGSILDSDGGNRNVCALKSISVRWGFIDFGVARSVSRKFYKDKKSKSGVEENDLLINSTGDGTIGRVAVYDRSFPAVVDGHITIVRFKDADLAWYVAAYLLSDEGQNQLYRYNNGSSGQVEIYPQDIARIWIPPKKPQQMKKIAAKLREACKKHDEFFTDLKMALSML